MMNKNGISIPDKYHGYYTDDIDEAASILREIFSGYNHKNIRADFTLHVPDNDEYNCRFSDNFDGVDFGSSGSWAFYDLKIVSTSPFVFEADDASIIPYIVGDKHD